MKTICWNSYYDIDDRDRLGLLAARIAFEAQNRHDFIERNNTICPATCLY